MSLGERNKISSSMYILKNWRTAVNWLIAETIFLLSGKAISINIEHLRLEQSAIWLEKFIVGVRKDGG